MASEVLYAVVSAKERVNFVSEASDTGEPVTYAEVNMKWRSDSPDSTPKITRSVTCSENSLWFYLVFALLFCSALLLITVILLAVKCYNR